MEISYRETKAFSITDLQGLFESVGWESGRYPEKLQTALMNSGTVFSAWYGDKLIGLVNALDDGILNAYIQYLLVDPAHQRQGIGRELLNRILRHYESYMRKTLIAYDHAVDFYKSCGFSVGEGKTPLSISNL